MISRTVDLSGPVHYVDFGGSGPPIVLVHGLGGSHRNWIGEQTSLDSGNGRESEGANDGMASLGTVAASTAASPSPREKAIRDLTARLGEAATEGDVELVGVLGAALAKLAVRQP